VCTYLKDCCLISTHTNLSRHRSFIESMNQKQKTMTVKSEEEKQKPKSKEKPNHKNFVSLLIKTYGSFGSEDLI